MEIPHSFPLWCLLAQLNCNGQKPNLNGVVLKVISPVGSGEILSKLSDNFSHLLRPSILTWNKTFFGITVKVSPSFTDAAMARLAQGTKVLAEGGHDKVFHQTFQNLPGEKLLHTYACYISTTSGPVIGTLYVSNRRIAFYSDFPLSLYSSTGNSESVYYKVCHPFIFRRTESCSLELIVNLWFQLGRQGNP